MIEIFVLVCVIYYWWLCYLILCSNSMCRSESAIVEERLVQSSWVSQTLTIADTLQMKCNKALIPQQSSNNQTLFPMPISISFHPKKNVRYCSRFRFSCEFANTFDVVLQGEGTYEEHEHHPLNPMPR